MEKTQRKEVFALWQQTSKEGKHYFSAKGGIVGFYNTNKKNPNEPDLRVHIKVKDQLEDYASLWCNVSDKGTKYLTGTLVHGNVRIVGFINPKSEGTKQPYIRFYEQDKKEVLDGKKQSAESEIIIPEPSTTADLPKEVVKQIKEDDLPF